MTTGELEGGTVSAPIPHLHWRRHVTVFIGGQTISLFGSMLVQYAVFWYLTVAFQSGVIMTLAAVFGFLPQAVVSVFAGVWADRTNRKWLIMGADAAIALSTLALALFLLAGYAEPWVIFATLAFRSMGAGVQTPAVSALIPQITPASQLMRVNGFLGSSQSALALVAPAAAGGLYAWAAAGSAGSPLALLPVFAIDIVTAVTGIALLATIPVKAVRTAASAGTGYFTDLADGVRYVATHAFVRWLLTLFAIIFLLAVAPSNLTPLMVVRSFPSGEQGNVVNLAILEVSFSVGMVAGGILVATLAAQWDRIRLISGSSLVFGGLSIALGLAPNLPVFFGIMLLIGLAVPFFSTSSMTLLQETVEPERQGRVFGFVGIVMAVAMPIGMLVFGPLADAIPIEIILVGSGLATFLVVGLALWLPAGRRAVAAAHAASAASMEPSGGPAEGEAAEMTSEAPIESTQPAPLPPRWVIRTFWAAHRAIHRLTGGRLGLRRATPKQWGMMRLETIGRRSGARRVAILGYFEDGPNVVTMAMNGWGEPEPAWWLNLQAQPDTTVVLSDGPREVRGRAATPDERPRLWARWAEYNGEENLASYARRRPHETAVVILEPR